MPRRRRWPRIARDEYALSAKTMRGVVRGPTESTRHSQAGHHLLKSWCVPSLARCEIERQRPTPAVGYQVNLGRQSATGAPEGMVIRLTDRSPF